MCRAFLALAKLIHHPFCSSWLLPFLVSALSFLLIPTSHLPPLLKTSLTYFVTHTKISDLNTHVAWHKTSPKPPILMSSLLTVPRSSNPIPFSVAFWLPRGLSFVTQRPLIRSSPLFSSSAFSLSMMRLSKVDNPDLPFSLHSSLVSASRSSPAIVNKLVQGLGEIFLKKNCSNDSHTRTLASLANQIRSSPMNLPPVSVPLSPIVPTTKTYAPIFLHPLCNLQLHWPHIPSLTSTSPKPSMTPRVFNPILFPIPKAS